MLMRSDSSRLEKLEEKQVSYHFYLQRLHSIETILDSNWFNINNLITSLHIDEVQPLLKLYSAQDGEKISELEKITKEIKQHYDYLISLDQQCDQLKKNIKNNLFLAKENSNNLNESLDNISSRSSIIKLELNIANSFCKTYSYRLKKQFNLALDADKQWINNIILYIAYLNDNKLPYLKDVANSWLVNAYNHKAKIHRALAGLQFEALDVIQLELAKESYLQALKIEPQNKDILNSIGFLLNDLSDLSSNKQLILQESLSYFNQALIIDNQDSNTHHGIGYCLYKLEKLKVTNMNIENLHQALLHLNFAQNKRPNSRLYLDKSFIYLLLKDEKKSLENLNQGLIMDPNHILLRYHRGCLFMNNKQFISALEDLRFGRALSIIDKNMTVLFDDSITKSENALNAEYKSYYKTNLENLNLYKIAKQSLFEKALQKLGLYAASLKSTDAKPAVFICYAWADAKHIQYSKQLIHEAEVKQLAKELELAGVTVYFDRWYDIKGHNMMQHIEKIFEGHVLVIGTHHFLEKCKLATNEIGPDPVLQTELYLLSYLLRINKTRRDKIIPLLLEGSMEESLPEILLPKTPVDLVKGDRHQEILKLVSAIHRLSPRDEKVEKITNHFEDISKEIDKQKPQELSKKYHSSVNSFFQQQFKNTLEAHEILDLTQDKNRKIRSKL